MKYVFALALIGVVVGRTYASAAVANVSVSVTIFGCEEDANSIPRLLMVPLGTPAQLNPTPLVGSVERTAVAGVFRGIIAVPPQNYTVAVKSEHCSTPGLFPVAVYPNLERNISLVTVSHPYQLVSLVNKSISVATPLGVSILLVPYGERVVGQRERTATRDGDAFYIESVNAGTYILKISVSGIVACRALTVPDGLDAFQSFIQLDIRDLLTMMRDSSRTIKQDCKNAPAEK